MQKVSLKVSYLEWRMLHWEILSRMQNVFLKILYGNAVCFTMQIFYWKVAEECFTEKEIFSRMQNVSLKTLSGMQYVSQYRFFTESLPEYRMFHWSVVWIFAGKKNVFLKEKSCLEGIFSLKVKSCLEAKCFFKKFCLKMQNVFTKSFVLSGIQNISLEVLSAIKMFLWKPCLH